MSQTFRSFKEFYPFYLSEHSKTGTRILHFTGTLFFFILLAYLLYSGDLRLIGFVVITPYAFAWVSHFFIEKNKPATFRYPLMSLQGDFKLFFQLLSGKEKFNPHQ